MTLNSATHLTGVASHFASEAVPGALPVGRNAPQRTPMRLLIAALALMASACTPMQGQTHDGASTGRNAEAACAARNGTIQRVGRLQTMQCVVRYADAGKRCTDGDQCAGDCRLQGDGSVVAPNASVAGICQSDSNRFGCQTPVEDGRVGPTLCVD